MQRHGRDDDHVAPLEQGVGRGVAEAVDLVVPRRVLLDVRVAPGQVRLGLVVVEVADEVLDRVLREELAELGVELRGERLVVREDQGRLVVVGDRPGEGGGLARAVAPSSVWWWTPLASPALSRSMAAGWSPVGSNGATNLKSGIDRSSLPVRARTEQVFCPARRRPRTPRRRGRASSSGRRRCR